MSEIELHRGTPFLSSAELNRLARQQELSVVIAKARIFDQICKEVELPDELEAELIQTFLQEEAISNDRELEDYLALRGWQEADLIYVATKAERLQRFQQQVFSQEVELNYLGRKLDLDQVHYTLICVEDADQAFEWHQRLLEGEAELDQFPAITTVESLGGLTSGRYGPQPISQAHHSLISRLRVGEPEQVWPPFFSDSRWVVLQLNQRLGTPLNERIYAELLDELFESWLNQRVSQLLTGEQPPDLPVNLLSQEEKSKEVINNEASKTEQEQEEEPLSVPSEIEAIAALLRSNQTEQARQQVEALMAKHPGDQDVLLITHTTYRSCGNHEQAFQIAQQLIEHHPSYFDGYARSAQDLLLLNKPLQALEQFEAGQSQADEPKNPWLLATGLKAAIASKDFSKAEAIGSTLYETSPDHNDLYEPYLYALIHNKHFKEASRIALDRANAQPEHFHIVHTAAKTLMRSQQLEDCRWLLYRSITAQRTRNYLRYLTEELYHVESQLRQQRAPQQREPGCDILCIAANEAPYIHEFIHHHIYLGFKNIFVGINNCKDNMLTILEKIRNQYPQVHIINADPVIKPFMQWGCYHRLFDIALDRSNSQHCLIVDIDEFWIADPFPQKIDSFIDGHAPFDAFSFHWIEALEEGLCDRPLSRDATYRVSPWVKSMFRYDTPLARIGVHGPILNGNEQDVTVCLGDSFNVNTEETLHGVEVLGLSPNTTASTTSKTNQAWVMHRANRSEIEYSASLFRPHANDDPSQVSLKSNRYGWEDKSHHDLSTTQYLRSIIDNNELSAYHQSLKKFTEFCQIDEEVAEARKPFSEEAIINSIQSMDLSLLKRDKDIALQVFKGTRFIHAIQERLKETEN